MDVNGNLEVPIISPAGVTVYIAPFLGAFAKLRKATISFVLSVRPSADKNSVPTCRIFVKFDT